MIEDFDQLVAAFADAGAEDGQQFGRLVGDVEGGVDHVGANEDRVAVVQHLAVLVQPLLDLAVDDVDDLFLIRVLVEVMAEAGHEVDFDDNQLLGAGAGRPAESAQDTPIQLFAFGFGRGDEFSDHL